MPKSTIAIGFAGKATGNRLGQAFQLHVLELFKRFAAPNGTLDGFMTNKTSEDDLPTTESFELWKETFGATFGFLDVSYTQYVVLISDTTLRYNLDTPPEYLEALAEAGHQYALEVIRGMAEIISSFVVAGPFKPAQLAALDMYKEQWFKSGATVLGVNYKKWTIYRVGQIKCWVV